YSLYGFFLNRTMATTIEQQVAMDKVLVPSTQRCPFFKAFLVTAYVPKIYMQEFLATTNEHITYLSKSPRSNFAELPFEEEILDFIRFLGHSATIRTLPDVNINKLYKPWRSFAAIINKCLTGKSSGNDSFRLSQAQILWGLYHKRNIDYAFLIWEDFVYQVEHNNHKKSNEMYYPRFTKVIIHHFMSKDPSIPKRNKVNWHYVRDDFLFSTIKVVSRHQNTQQYGVMLPIELTNDKIRNTKAYKEYYAFATGKAAPKPKASARRKKSDSDTSITPLTATTTLKPTVAVPPKLTAATKGKQTAKAPKSKSLYAPSEPGVSGTAEGIGADDQEKVGDDDEGYEGNDREEGEEDDDEEDKDGDERDDDDEDQEIAKDDEQNDTKRSGDDTEEGESDEEEDDEETRDEESFYLIPQTPKSSKDEGDGEEDQGRGLQVNQEVKDSHVILTPINSDGQQKSSSVSSQFVTNMLNPTSDAGMESIFATASTSVAPLSITAPTMIPSTVTTITTTSQAPIPPTPIPREVLQNLPTFASVFHFNDRLRSLEQNFSEVMQTNQFAGAVFAIPEIVEHFMDQRMNEAVKVVVQLQSDRLCEEAQKENDEFLRTVDENIKKIIKEKIKE
nr:hypothetical protein [Tanacetum cinerariifolium]